MADQKRKGFHALEEKIHEMEAEDEKAQQPEQRTAGSPERSEPGRTGQRPSKGPEKK